MQRFGGISRPFFGSLVQPMPSRANESERVAAWLVARSSSACGPFSKCFELDVMFFSCVRSNPQFSESIVCQVVMAATIEDIQLPAVRGLGVPPPTTHVALNNGLYITVDISFAVQVLSEWAYCSVHSRPRSRGRR